MKVAVISALFSLIHGASPPKEASPWKEVSFKKKLFVIQVHVDQKTKCMGLLLQKDLGVTLAECTGADASKITLTKHQESDVNPTSDETYIRDYHFDVKQVTKDPGWRKETPKLHNVAFLEVDDAKTKDSQAYAEIPSKEDYKNEGASLTAIKYKSTTNSRFPKNKRGDIQGRDYKFVDTDVCAKALARKLGEDEYCLEPIVKASPSHDLKGTELGSAIFFANSDAKIAGIINDLVVKDKVQYIVIESIYHYFVKLAFSKK